MSSIQKIVFTGTLGVLGLFAQVGRAQEETPTQSNTTREQMIETTLRPSNGILANFSKLLLKQKPKNLSEFNAHLTSSLELGPNDNSINSLEFNFEAKIKDTDERLNDKILKASMAVARGIPCSLDKNDGTSKDVSHLVIEARIPMNALDYLKVVAQRAAENDSQLFATESEIVQSLIEAESFSDLGDKWNKVIVPNLGAKESNIWTTAGSMEATENELKLALNFDSDEKLALMPAITRIAKAIRMNSVEKGEITLRMHKEFMSFKLSVCGAQDEVNWIQNKNEVLDYSKNFDKKEIARHQVLAATVLPEIVNVITGEGFHKSFLLKIK